MHKQVWNSVNSLTYVIEMPNLQVYKNFHFIVIIIILNDKFITTFKQTIHRISIFQQISYSHLEKIINKRKKKIHTHTHTSKAIYSYQEHRFYYQTGENNSSTMLT